MSKTLVHFLPQDLEELHTLQKHWVSEAPLFRALTHLDISHCRCLFKVNRFARSLIDSSRVCRDPRVFKSSELDPSMGA